VAMGRAIVRRPQVFLMDEPLSNLDAKLRVQMRAEISRLQHNLGVTTVYVTHDQIEAMTMGDRVAVLSAGYLQQIDTPQALYDRPDNLFVATFIGSPQLNLVMGRVAASETGPVQLTVGSFTLDLPATRLADSPRLREYDGREVIVGIRPEDFEDTALVDDRAQRQTVQVNVLLREGLGAEVVVHATIDANAPAHAKADVDDETLFVAETGAPIIARLDARTQVRIDEPATLTVAVDRLHFFDVDTGLAIRE